MNKLVGSVIASSAAMLFTAGTVIAQDSKPADDAASKPAKPDVVKCVGINACKAKGQCGGTPGADHQCAGKNACKGKGWIKVSPAECKEKGGKPRAAAKKKKDGK